MNDSTSDRIAVTYSLTADDYASYFVVLGRQQRSGWKNLGAYAAALFGAIPVALLFRSIGARLSGNAAAADLIGKFSLAAFLLGTVAIVVAGSVMRRMAIRKHLARARNAQESKTAVIDAAGITLSGQSSQAMWRWATISGLTSENDLLLIWIGQSPAVIIPSRSFASNGARDAAKAFIRARLSEAHRA